MGCGGGDHGSYSSGGCGGSSSTVEYVRSGCGGGHYVTTIGQGCGARTVKVKKGCGGVWEEEERDNYPKQGPSLSIEINNRRRK